jgi:hypothetical protein
MRPTLSPDQVVSDEVWAQLDPNAGRLTRRTVAKMVATLVATILVGIAGLAVYRGGYLTPRLRADGATVSFERPVAVSSEHPILLAVNFELTDHGNTGVTVRSLGGDVGPWKFVSTWNLPSHLAPAEAVIVKVTYRLDSCDGLPTSEDLPSFQIPMVVQHWWGSQHLRLPVADPGLNPCGPDF